jgi:hypothetical protein
LIVVVFVPDPIVETASLVRRHVVLDRIGTVQVPLPNVGCVVAGARESVRDSRDGWIQRLGSAYDAALVRIDTG